MPAERSLDTIEAEAARWLLRSDDVAWSARDAVELEAWLTASASHRVAYLRLKSAWVDADRLARFSAAPASARPRRNPRRWSGRWARAAMAVAVLSGGVLAIAVWPPRPPSYQTAVGGLAIIPLDDGSTVTLNTDSEIALRMTAGERRVQLLRGEAYFDVAPDPARPFVVQADARRVVAVGTRFSVRIQPDATVQVAVTEGRVRMEQDPGWKAAWPTWGDAGPSLPPPPLLEPGNIVVAGPATLSLQRQPLSEVEQMLGWRNGRILLQRVTLEAAIAEFNRYSHRQVALADPELGHVRVGGSFRTDNLDGFVRLLQEGFDIHAQVQGDRILLDRAAHRGVMRDE